MNNGTGTDRRRLVREFVEYLELISREWGSSKPTARIGTNEVCAFIQQATADCHASLFFPKISDDAMLEAYRADKARWFARRGCTGAESVHAGRTDGDAAEAVAQGLLGELRGAKCASAMWRGLRGTVFRSCGSMTSARATYARRPPSGRSRGLSCRRQT